MKKISFDIPDVDMDERGVSPVIGVILMVAITVILAAVIASFVLGFGDNVSQEVQAGASISYDAANDEVTVTWVSEGSATQLNVTSSAGTVSNSPVQNVGDTASVSGATSGTTITVTAYDGDTQTVVAQKTVGQ